MCAGVAVPFVAAAASTAVCEALVPTARCIVEVFAILATLTKPERLVLTDVDDVRPRVSGLFVGKLENDVDFF